MPRRRRVVASAPSTPSTRKSQNSDDLSVARGRLKGALLDALEYNAEDSDSSYEPPMRNSRSLTESKVLSGKREINCVSSDEDEYLSERGRKSKKKSASMHKSYPYVMKLFDRSVDLSQFSEDTPLYPICRAWMANKPRGQIKSAEMNTAKEELIDEGIKLPLSQGASVSRIPPLLPEQAARNKNNINLDYDTAPLMTKTALLHYHTERWQAVRENWLQQSALVEARYADTQKILNEIEVKNY